MQATISSVKDPRIATIRDLSTAAARRAAGRCVLVGELLIAQAVEAGAKLDFVLHTDAAPDTAAPTILATPTVLKQALRSQKPVTAVAVAQLPAERSVPRGDFAVVLDHVADPGNLGTIVRTACGLGAHDIVLTDAETDLTSRRVLEASRASVLRADVTRHDSVTQALTSLRTNGFEIVVTSPRGKTVQARTPLSGAPVALVVGNETDGVCDSALELADHVVRIPMAGRVESLNVGVSTGVSISDLRTEMIRASLPARSRRVELTEQARARLDALDGCEAFPALLSAARGEHVDDAELSAQGLVQQGALSAEGTRLLATLWLEVFGTDA